MEPQKIVKLFALDDRRSTTATRDHALNLPAMPPPIIKSSYFSTLAIGFTSLTGCPVEFPLRKVDWHPCDVAYVVFEDVQRDVGNRLDDFAVA
jgi:hypothetical protein